jgi:hypothetical protein
MAARADVFGPISLVSANASEQSAVAHDPAISGNGQYVAFDGQLEGLEGVWRKDLRTGAIEPVAVGEPGSADGSAALPSISESGQYISFTTNQRLAPVYQPEPEQEGVFVSNVYVRNMSIPGSQACQEFTPEELAAVPAPTQQECAYTLVSAVNGAPTGLRFAGPRGGSEANGYGALAAGRAAISADGKEVAFVTTGYSDLTTSEEAELTTPPFQVAVRNLATDETHLVSDARSPVTGLAEPDQPVSGEESGVLYGAVYLPGGHLAPFPDTSRAYGPMPPVGASISADGTTVAWMGADVGQQARVLAKEELKPGYAEPLWHRIADGPEAPTRRVTGGSDPESAACIASGEKVLAPHTGVTDPCQGPFAIEDPFSGTFSGEAEAVPQMSASGVTVAFLSTAALVGRGGAFGFGERVPSDLFIANMQEGLTRDQALRPITQVDGAGQAEAGAIEDFAISADGTQLAFTTRRTLFTLGSLAYVSVPQTQPGLGELFEADLTDGTVTRVTGGFEGGAAEHPHPTAHPGEDPYVHAGDGAVSPSIADDGDAIAFASTASNLVYGDGNTPPNEQSLAFDGSDAFVIDRLPVLPQPTPFAVSPYTVNPTLSPAWRMSVTAYPGRHGTVVLEVRVPGPGSLHAVADSAVVVRAAAARRAVKRSGYAGRMKPPGRGTVADRTVASATQAFGAPEGGTLKLTLRLAPRYVPLAAQPGGLWSTVHVKFTAPGHAALQEALGEAFVVRQGRSTGAKRSQAAARAPGARG